MYLILVRRNRVGIPLPSKRAFFRSETSQSHCANTSDQNQKKKSNLRSFWNVAGAVHPLNTQQWEITLKGSPPAGRIGLLLEAFFLPSKRELEKDGGDLEATLYKG